MVAWVVFSGCSLEQSYATALLWHLLQKWNPCKFCNGDLGSVSLPGCLHVTAVFGSNLLMQKIGHPQVAVSNDHSGTSITLPDNS